MLEKEVGIRATMRIPLISLTRQYDLIRDEIDESIRRVLETGWFILGKNTQLFEKEFSKYCGVEYGIAVGSGSDALFLSLKALGISEGDEVITVANTFISIANAILLNQARPVFVDICPETYNIDVGKIKRKISERTKAILPVHLYGHPADMDSILEIADEYGLYVVEDACQAHGAEYKKARVGQFGTCACFSFYPSKNLGAYGDGGMVLTNDKEIAEKIRSLREYGQKTKYYYALVGYNSRLDEIQAAILRVKLRHLDEWIEMRRKNAKIYSDLLCGLPEFSLPIEKDCAKHVYYLYVIRSEKRETLQSYLASRGVTTGIHYPVPIHLQEAYRYLGLEKGSLPITEEYSRQVLSLPMFPELTEAEIEYVSNSIGAFCKSYN